MTKEEIFAHLDRILGPKLGLKIDMRVQDSYIDREFLMNIEKVDFHQFNSDGSFYFEIGDPEPNSEATSKSLKRQGIVGLFKVTPNF